MKTYLVNMHNKNDTTFIYIKSDNIINARVKANKFIKLFYKDYGVKYTITKIKLFRI